MPKRSRLKLPPLDLGAESLGERITRLRKTAGLSQVQLAERIGIIQAIVSAHELDKLKLSAEMVVRYALALGVSADELLGMNAARKSKRAAAKAKVEDTKMSLTLVRRLQGIQQLPWAQQKTLLRTIDVFLQNAEK